MVLSFFAGIVLGGVLGVFLTLRFRHIPTAGKNRSKTRSAPVNSKVRDFNTFLAKQAHFIKDENEEVDEDGVV